MHVSTYLPSEDLSCCQLFSLFFQHSTFLSSVGLVQLLIYLILPVWDKGIGTLVDQAQDLQVQLFLLSLK